MILLPFSWHQEGISTAFYSEERVNGNLKGRFKDFATSLALLGSGPPDSKLSLARLSTDVRSKDCNMMIVCDSKERVTFALESSMQNSGGIHGKAESKALVWTNVIWYERFRDIVARCNY